MLDYKIHQLGEFAQTLENAKEKLISYNSSAIGPNGIDEVFNKLIASLGKIDDNIGPPNLNVISSLLHRISNCPDDKLRLRIERAVQEISGVTSDEPGCLSDEFVERIDALLP